MRSYYLLPESTVERVLTGIKPKCANPTGPGDADGQTSLNPQSLPVYDAPAAGLVPTNIGPVVSPHGATTSSYVRSVKKKSHKKTKYLDLVSKKPQNYHLCYLDP